MATATAPARSLRGPGHPGPSREVRLDAAHATLLTGIATLTTSDALTAMLATAARFHTYSPSNCLMILAQRPDATRVAGLRTWNSLGRHVNKGEHGIRIIVPLTRKSTDETTGDANQPHIIGFTVGTVFDESQTSGADLENVAPELLTGPAIDGLIPKICALIEAQGFTVVFGDCRPANGLTSWLTNTVTIRDDIDPAAQCKTLFHEAGHVLAHAPEILTEPVCRGIKEVEAESIAYIVAATLGFDTSAYSFPYIGHWASGVGELSAVQATAERVITIARTIVNSIDT